MALSTCLRPSIEACLPGNLSELCRWRCNTGERIPDISEDLPDPETPVIEVKQPNGIWTSILVKLLCLAPLISNHFLDGDIRVDGGLMERRPDR